MSKSVFSNEISLDNFCFIGNKIFEKIYEIPEDDLKYFNQCIEKINKWKKFYDLYYGVTIELK